MRDNPEEGAIEPLIDERSESLADRPPRQPVREGSGSKLTCISRASELVSLQLCNTPPERRALEQYHADSSGGQQLASCRNRRA
uniref:Uncharacterized protein n=1 Tax=Setaria digitata TaxID=48799 RepID=A0A915PMZ3_9BILA